jgi:uncharacterized damage-inducible protein DinB
MNHEPETQNIQSFLAYFTKIRERTVRVVQCIPHDQLEWTFQPGRFTLGDLARHIALTERYVFAETVRSNQIRYAGCGKELADGYEHVVALMDRLHRETLAILSVLSPEDLQRKCVTAEGYSIAVWKWLRSMVEHEVHHRGQIYTYLAMLGVPTPPLYGLTSEQLRERSAVD